MLKLVTNEAEKFNLDEIVLKGAQQMLKWPKCQMLFKSNFYNVPEP